MAQGIKAWDARHRWVGFTVLLYLFLLLPPAWALFDAIISGSTQHQRVDDALSLYITTFLHCTLIATVATGLGWSLALCLQKTGNAKTLYLFLLIMPFFLPSYVLGLAWQYLFQPGGLAQSLFGMELSGHLRQWRGFNSTLAVSASVNWLYPIPLAGAYVALRAWNIRSHEAARLYLAPRDAFFKIHLPYFAPFLAITWILVFLLAQSNFSIPDLLQVRVYATETFALIAAHHDYRGAILFSLLPAGIAIGLYIAGLPLLRRSITVLSFSTRTSLQASPAFSIANHSFLILAVIVLVTSPIGQIISQIESWQQIATVVTTATRDTLNSIIMASMVTASSLSLGYFLGYSYARSIAPGGQWARILVMLPFVLPAALLGVATIQSWNNLPILNWAYGFGLALIMVLALRLMPIATEVIGMGIRQIPQKSEEAAFVHSHSWYKSQTKFMLPQLRTTLIAAGLVIFCLAFNDLTTAILLAPPGVDTLPTRIFSYIHYGPDSLIAAICLWQITVLAATTLIGFMLLNWAAKNDA